MTARNATAPAARVVAMCRAIAFTRREPVPPLLAERSVAMSAVIVVNPPEMCRKPLFAAYIQPKTRCRPCCAPNSPPRRLAPCGDVTVASFRSQLWSSRQNWAASACSR